jgi:hypothetical protein
VAGVELPGPEALPATDPPLQPPGLGPGVDSGGCDSATELPLLLSLAASSPVAEGGACALAARMLVTKAAPPTLKGLELIELRIPGTAHAGGGLAEAGFRAELPLGDELTLWAEPVATDVPVSAGCRRGVTSRPSPASGDVVAAAAPSAAADGGSEVRSTGTASLGRSLPPSVGAGGDGSEIGPAGSVTGTGASGAGAGASGAGGAGAGGGSGAGGGGSAGGGSGAGGGGSVESGGASVASGGGSSETTGSSLVTSGMGSSTFEGGLASAAASSPAAARA